MKTITHSTYVVLLLIIASLVAGCASTSSGIKIDQNKVSQIRKGVTTKAQVEALLGSPTMVSMMGGGRRMMLYNYTEFSARPTAASFIPGFGGLIGGSSERRTQTLQIMINKSGVVEDYEFSDNKQATEGGLANSHTVSTPSEGK